MKILLLFIILNTFLLSKNINYAVLNKHSYTLPEGKLEVKASYLKVNSTIDVLNIKEDELGSNSSDFGSIGDMDGFDFELRYGLTQRDSLFLKVEQWNIDYGDSTLKNYKIDLFNRFNILNNDYTFINSLSVDVGFRRDSAKTLRLSNDTILNKLIDKFKPNNDVTLNNGDIIVGDTTFALYDENGQKILPAVDLQNLESDTYYTRLILGKNISENSLVDFYIGYGITDISTSVSLYPDTISQFFDGAITKDLNRKEENLNLGFVYTAQTTNWIYEFNYEYNKIFRDSTVSSIDNSHIVEASISRVIDKNFLIYIGGRLMLEQFNSDIPYLYNEYTKTQFDKKYGMAKIGIVYSFRGLK